MIRHASMDSSSNQMENYLHAQESTLNSVIVLEEDPPLLEHQVHGQITLHEQVLGVFWNCKTEEKDELFSCKLSYLRTQIKQRCYMLKCTQKSCIFSNINYYYLAPMFVDLDIFKIVFYYL